MAKDAAVRGSGEHLVGNSGVPVKVGKLTLSYDMRLEIIHRTLLLPCVPDINFAVCIACRKVVLVMRIKRNMLDPYTHFFVLIKLLLLATVPKLDAFVERRTDEHIFVEGVPRDTCAMLVARPRVH